MNRHIRTNRFRGISALVVAGALATACSSGESAADRTIDLSSDSTAASTADVPASEPAVATTGVADSSTAEPSGEGCDAEPVDSGPGGRVFAIADADMVATAYTNDLLGDPTTVPDSLGVYRPSAGAAELAGSVDVSNAVTSAVWVFDVGTDGRFVYAVENLKQRTAEMTTLQDLEVAAGDVLTTVDLCADAPTAIDTRSTISRPTTVSVNAQGTLLAVAGREPAAVALHRVGDDGVPGDPIAVDLIPSVLQSPTGAVSEVTHAEWNPDGDVLAVTVRESQTVSFYELTGTSDAPSLVPFGEPVPIDTASFGGQWSPDGEFFYVTNVRGADERFRPTPFTADDLNGSVQVVDVADTGAQTPTHAVVQRESTPIWPEGIAVSPNGLWVATVNMQTSALPPGNGLYAPESTVSLWSRNPADGALTKVGDTSFEGILPEGAAFDPTSRYLAVAVYHPTGADRTAGAVDIWRLTPGEGTGLALDSRTIGPRGIHHVEWVR
jgi:hypothetical protein